MIRSCLYECTVMHRRILPKKHEFVYRIFLFFLDLDELGELEDSVPVFSSDKPNLYSLRSEVSVVQVGNTFGELKPYLVPLGAGQFRVRVPKHFYVSPFSDLDLAFDFRLDPPGERLRVLIDDYSGETKTLVSSLTGKHLALTLGNLLLLTIKYPLVTLKIIALIHWEAFRLWLKGIPHRLKEANPHLQKGAFRARE